MKISRATTFPDFHSDSCGQKSSSKSFQIRRHSETEISVPAVEFTAVLIKKYSISGSPLYTQQARVQPPDVLCSTS
eukprot:COSAG01_NODE_588_length_15134_cov_34.601796_8_plen_76_part_00